MTELLRHFQARYIGRKIPDDWGSSLEVFRHHEEIRFAQTLEVYRTELRLGCNFTWDKTAGAPPDLPDHLIPVLAKRIYGDITDELIEILCVAEEGNRPEVLRRLGRLISQTRGGSNL